MSGKSLVESFAELDVAKKRFTLAFVDGTPRLSGRLGLSHDWATHRLADSEERLRKLRQPPGSPLRSEP